MSCPTVCVTCWGKGQDNTILTELFGARKLHKNAARICQRSLSLLKGQMHAVLGCCAPLDNSVSHLLYPLIPQIHHTVVIGFAFHQAKRNFCGHRGKERFAIADHHGMDQHIDSVPQVIFQK